MMFVSMALADGFPRFLPVPSLRYIKKYFSFNLLKLVKRAIQEIDLDLLKVLVEDV